MKKLLEIKQKVAPCWKIFRDRESFDKHVKWAFENYKKGAITVEKRVETVAYYSNDAGDIEYVALLI